MLTHDNLKHVEEERNTKANVTDFGSTFRKHDDAHKRL